MKRILFPLLFLSLILGCSNSDTKKEYEHTPHLPVDTFIPKKENILKRPELINEDEDQLFTDKDFFKATPVDISLHREMEKVHLKSGNTSTSKRRQRHFKEFQKLLDRYPNSTRLLTTLVEYGYNVYPKQSLAYANKAIEIEPSLVKSYILSSDCYQILGDYDNPSCYLLPKSIIILVLIMNKYTFNSKPAAVTACIDFGKSCVIRLFDTSTRFLYLCWR